MTLNTLLGAELSFPYNKQEDKIMKFNKSSIIKRVIPVFGLTGVIFSISCCPAWADDEQDPNKTFEKIRSAIQQNDQTALAELVDYPIQICYENKLQMITDKSEFQKLNLEKLFGNAEVLKAMQKYMANISHGEPLEFYAGTEEYPFGINGYDEKTDASSFFVYTVNGIHEINSSTCEAQIPKSTFCNNKRQDAKITMYANYSALWHKNTYENFVDYNYSSISLNTGFVKELELTLQGQKFKLTRDNHSLLQMPVYSDETHDYLIMTPSRMDSLMCDEPDDPKCAHFPEYVHIFRKAKDSTTCDDGEIVLAEKYSLNFCPFNQINNTEIRLFTSGFKSGIAPGDDLNSTYSNSESGTSVKFIKKNDSDGYEQTFAVLTYNGSEYEIVVNDYDKTIFNTADKEILAIFEGDYDQAGNVDNLRCGLGECSTDRKRIVLFARDKNGVCERIALANNSIADRK